MRGALLVTLLASSPGRADDCHDAAKSSGACKPVEIVVTGTRTPESSQRASVRTDFVTRDEAERRGATNVAEALAGEPTLQVNPENYGYLGRPSGVQMQGLDADRVLVLEDGERVIGDLDGVVDLAQLPLADVDRIEYVAGPTSSLYGSNALGGVINVVSAPPRALGPSARYRAELRTSGEALAGLSGAYRADDDWLVLDTSLHERPSLRRQPDLPDTLAPRWRSSLLGLRAGTRLSRRAELKLRARWVRDDSRGVQSEQLPGLGTYVSDLPDVTDRFLLRAQQTLELAGGARIDFSLIRSDYLDASRLDRRSSPLDELRRRRLSNQALEAILTLPDGPNRTWVIGVRDEAEHYSQSLTRVQRDLSQQRVSEIDPRLLPSAALYGQLGWKVSDAWTLMPGARAELHGSYGSVAAPRLATAYQFSRVVSARAALGRGFRAPSAKEFGFLFDHSALGYRVLGNADLRPESSWGFTADLSARFERVRLRAGVFGNRIQDLITLQIAPPGTHDASPPIAGVTDYVYRNVARARTAGGDVGARVKLGAGLALDAAYAYLWTRDDEAHEPLTGRPHHTLTCSGLLELGSFTGSLRYRFVSTAYAGLIEDERRDSPAFGLLDARLSYRALAWLSVFVGALNLTGERRDYLDAADTRPVQGRQLYVGLLGEAPGE